MEIGYVQFVEPSGKKFPYKGLFQNHCVAEHE
jgi:hypothetical protein